MKSRVNVFTLVIIAITSLACTVSDGLDDNATVCTNAWYALVEQKIPTGDGSGHGPDLGSLEWHSVVEFKLGIRDDPTIPELDTEQWCSHIHSHYVSSDEPAEHY